VNLKQVAQNDDLLTRYLLGDLSDEEQERVEERYISDPGFYDQLLVAEDDLIDSYAERALTPQQLAGFEKHFLRSPERQKKVAFAEAWMAYVARQSVAAKAAAVERKITEKKRSLFEFLRPAAWPLAARVAAAVLVLVVGGWLIFEVLRLKTQVEQTEAQRAALQQQNEDLAQQIDAEKNHSLELAAKLEEERLQPPAQPNQVSSNIVSFFLTPGLLRGNGEAKRNVIPTGAREVNLQLSFNDEQYERYDVVITNVEGREVWRKDAGKPQSRNGGKAITVRVPAGLFKTNDYIVNVIGTDSSDKVARFVFTVVRQ
jgi:anti-sigma factor RsiW